MMHKPSVEQKTRGMVITNHQHGVRHSSGQFPRSVSVKKNADGSNEITVESSVSVSCTFKQDAIFTSRQEDVRSSVFPGDHDSRHQLVCCTCMISKPRMLVGECGCLACMDCMVMIKHKHCNNCQTSVRYTFLEKLIVTSDNGYVGKIFMDKSERESVTTKEFLARVVKEEKEFMAVSKILDKQEAALHRKNNYEKIELEKMSSEENKLKQKLLDKNEAISKLEEAVRLKQNIPSQRIYKCEYQVPSEAENHRKGGNESVEVNKWLCQAKSSSPSVKPSTDPMEKRNGNGEDQIRNVMGDFKAERKYAANSAKDLYGLQKNFTPSKVVNMASPVLKGILKKKTSKREIDSAMKSSVNETKSGNTVYMNGSVTTTISASNNIKNGILKNAVAGQVRHYGGALTLSRAKDMIDDDIRREIGEIRSGSKKEDDSKRIRIDVRNKATVGLSRDSGRIGMNCALKNAGDIGVSEREHYEIEKRRHHGGEREKVGGPCEETKVVDVQGIKGDDEKKGHSLVEEASRKTNSYRRFKLLQFSMRKGSNSNPLQGLKGEAKDTRSAKKAHNMTYDYLDSMAGSVIDAEMMPVQDNNKITENRNRSKAASRGTSEAENVLKSGVGVTEKNSQVFWQQYLL